MRFNLIKYIEAVLALYAASVGMVMLGFPAQLDHQVYAPWHRLGVAAWGVVLVTISVLHLSALILNGRNRIISRTLRAVANSSHLYLSIHFAMMFAQSSAAWGVLTFGILVPGLVLPIAASTIIDAMDAVHVRRCNA